jgi:hypothetical protein
VFERAVLVDEAAEARPDIEQVPTSPREERPKRDPVAQIFVGPGCPEGVAVRKIVGRGLVRLANRVEIGG